MDRILALQNLGSFIDLDQPDDLEASNQSNQCSSESSGGGKSSCSNICTSAEELDW